MQRMWEFKIGRFILRADIEPCFDPDLSWDETGEAADKIANGIWGCFNTRVSISLNGAVIASDWLCESIYADPRDFFTEHYGLAAKSRADGTNYGAYFPDMVRTAIIEARQWLNDAKLAA